MTSSWLPSGRSSTEISNGLERRCQQVIDGERDQVCRPGDPEQDRVAMGDIQSNSQSSPAIPAATNAERQPKVSASHGTTAGAMIAPTLLPELNSAVA
jgi:hypothetical protein